MSGRCERGVTARVTCAWSRIGNAFAKRVPTAPGVYHLSLFRVFVRNGPQEKGTL